MTRPAIVFETEIAKVGSSVMIRIPWRIKYKAGLEAGVLVRVSIRRIRIVEPKTEELKIDETVLPNGDKNDETLKTEVLLNGDKNDEDVRKSS